MRLDPSTLGSLDIFLPLTGVELGVLGNCERLCALVHDEWLLVLSAFLAALA